MDLVIPFSIEFVYEGVKMILPQLAPQF